MEGVGHACRLANILHFLFISPFFSPLSLFSLLSPFSFGPVSAYKRLAVQRQETGLRHSTQLLLIRLHSRGQKCAHLHAHTQPNKHAQADLSPYNKSCKVTKSYLASTEFSHSLPRKKKKEKPKTG